MSIYIRRKYADWKGEVQCFTCFFFGPWTELQAGHYKHKYLDFDEKNIHPQCDVCNRWSYGRPGVYKQRLVATYGEEVLIYLDNEVKKEKQRIDKLGYSYTKTELEAIIIDLQIKIKVLDAKESTYAPAVSQ
jgi:hypothetical protein